MIKIIKNITPETLSISLFGHNYDIPAGWSLSAEEVWGGEETLRYVAVKFCGKIEMLNEEGEKIEQVECPGCGSIVSEPKEEGKEEGKKPKERVKK